MALKRFRRLPVGARVGDDLTILGVVAHVHGRHPVYIAWSRSAWAPVACKLFRSDSDAEDEAKILDAVAHPGIVRSLGARSPRALAMEFLEGPTLSSELRRQGRFRVGDALRAAIHLGAALQHVHAKGWLHLDLKPGNVIVSNGRPVLFDFGTARPVGYQPKHWIGTDQYMAPEMCRLGEPLTPAADVYGLGATLYELLTGAGPFDHLDKHAQLRQAPRPAREVRPSLSRSLSEEIGRALAFDPNERPPLRTLMIKLHEEIRSGPRMWPAGFTPAEDPKPPRVRAPLTRNGAEGAAS